MINWRLLIPLSGVFSLSYSMPQGNTQLLFTMKGRREREEPLSIEANIMNANAPPSSLRLAIDSMCTECSIRRVSG